MIDIANPRPGGAKHCSDTRAAHFIAKGIAVRLPDGRIRFRDQDRLRFQAHEFRQTLWEERRAFDQYRKGKVFWNGSTGALKMHRPGEVIS
jgi:hypothetical protein